MLQLYAPTTEQSDEEIETFYEEVDNALKHTKSTDNIIIMGDFNAKVGNTAMSRCVGNHGLAKPTKEGKIHTILRTSQLVYCKHNVQTAKKTPLHVEEPG